MKNLTLVFVLVFGFALYAQTASACGAHKSASKETEKVEVKKVSADAEEVADVKEAKKECASKTSAEKKECASKTAAEKKECASKATATDKKECGHKSTKSTVDATNE